MGRLQMAVDFKQIVLIPIALSLLTGCGIISVAETPAGWGSRAGRAGAEMWIEDHGRDGYPSAKGIATYCVSIAEEGLSKFDWDFEQAIAASDACTEAFAKGLT